MTAKEENKMLVDEYAKLKGKATEMFYDKQCSHHTGGYVKWLEDQVIETRCNTAWINHAKLHKERNPGVVLGEASEYWYKLGYKESYNG
jgi:hypothetical protein